MFKTSRIKSNEKIIQHLEEQLSGKLNIKSNLDNNYEVYNELVYKLRNYYEKFNYKEDKGKYLTGKLIVLESEKLNISESKISKSAGMLFTIMLAFLSVFTSFSIATFKNDNNMMIASFTYIAFAVGVSILYFAIVDRLDLNLNTRNKNKSIAINIHKSVIEEQLQELEENEKVQEKEDEVNKKLAEILKTVEGTKREAETLGRLFGND